MPKQGPKGLSAKGRGHQRLPSRPSHCFPPTQSASAVSSKGNANTAVHEELQCIKQHSMSMPTLLSSPNVPVVYTATLPVNASGVALDPTSEILDISPLMASPPNHEAHLHSDSSHSGTSE